MSELQLYRKMEKVCTENLYPQEMIEFLLPHFLDYIRTGKMDAVILHGSPGCGKTSAGMTLAREVLLLPCIQCYAASKSRSGIDGLDLYWLGATPGAVVRGCLENEMLNPVLLIDEGDKTVEDPRETNLQDLLLSITDDRRIFHENFLDMEFPVLGPLLITANDIEKVSEPLKDRCDIFYFPDATQDRLSKIVSKYRDSLLEERGHVGRIILPDAVLEEGIDLYYKHEHSIRKHKQLVKRVLNLANVASLKKGAAKLEIPKDVFAYVIEKQIQEASSANKRARKMGFA